MKKYLSCLYYLLILVFPHRISSQDTDLLGLLGDTPVVGHISNAFKSSRIINGNSMEMLPTGVMDFRILHRFGELSGGGYEFFGLDQASMRMGLDYGLTKNLMLGIGCSTFRYDKV
jgi:hypothetical protein